MRTFIIAIAVAGAAVACSSSNSNDAGPGSTDSGPGPNDAGLVDAGPQDAGPVDAGPVDAGPSCDAGYPTGNLGGLDCDPMVPEQCGFPFPSNVYLAANSSSPTCFNVQFGATTLPVIFNKNINPQAWSDSDGFSPGATAMTYLPGATITGLPDQNHIADSIVAASTPTILLDTSTSPPTLVPHFAELDVTDSKATDQSLLVHPMIRLKDATRYIVAVRNVVDSAGTAIAPSPTFAALLNGTAAPMINDNGSMITDPTVAPRTALYADIFSKLAAAGIPTTGLQIAWDFTTASQQNNVGQLESMYEQALAALPDGGPEYTITSTVDNPDEYTLRRIRGLITVPLFLDQAKVTIDANEFTPDLTTGYTMTRVNGVPQLNGTGQFEFIVNVPKQAATNGPLPIVIQGHGLFSDRSEGQNALDSDYAYLIQLAQNQGYVTVALDMIGWRSPNSPDGGYGNNWPPDWGMYGDTNLENDQEKALGFVNIDIGGFRRMVDRATQGMLNELIAVDMMKTSFSKDPSVMLGPDGGTAIDTSNAFYRGDSEGGIIGTTFMTLTHDCPRGYLGEPGGPFSFIIYRSGDFAEFLNILLGNYSTGNPAMNVQTVTGLMQMFWDRWEGNGFVPYLTENTLSAETPSHHVLVVDALGDGEVTPLGAQYLARSMGAVQMEPGIREIYGIPDMTGPISGMNVLQEFDFGILTDPNDTVPQTDTPPTGPDDPHGWARLTEPSFLEMDSFFKTGSVSDECGAVDGGTPTTCVYPTQEP